MTFFVVIAKLKPRLATWFSLTTRRAIIADSIDGFLQSTVHFPMRSGNLIYTNEVSTECKVKNPDRKGKDFASACTLGLGHATGADGKRVN